MHKTLLLGCLILSTQLFAQTQEQDLLEFAEGSVFKTNIYELDALNLKKSMLPDHVRPWSGSYWADRAGSIAVRYTNSDLGERVRIGMGTNNSRRAFEKNLEKLQAELTEMNEEELGKLSPAEKYDLLVGDLNFTFSRQLWAKIDENQEHWGQVTMWTGICHGWSPASIHLPRPSKMIRLPILNGTRMLPVYPDDVKALGSYLWANKANDGEQMFAGNRCNQKSPEINPDTGEVIPLRNFSRSANECADVDPLVMHLVTTNRIGIMKRSFVVEIDYNAPVNNHPLAGYELTYFNVNNHKDASLSEAIVPLHLVKDDKLKNVRHAQTTQVLGVEMKLLLTHWQNPVRRDTDTVNDDKILEETIIYELDLDARGEPLKGHWRIGRKGKTSGRPHFPDFIWNDYHGFRPQEFFTNISRGLTVDLVQGLANGWTAAAQKNSSNIIKLSNVTRLSHRLSKKEGLQEEASRRMKSENISRAEAANQLADLLTGAGVPEKGMNPQLLSGVVLELFELVK